jgi:hypothetical protein
MQSGPAQDVEILCPVTDSAEPDEKSNENIRGREEQKIHELLKSINEESIQLGKILTDENRLVEEVCSSLMLITRKMGVSFNISPQSIPFKKPPEKVILSKEGRLTLTYEKDVEDSAFLAEYPPETVMATLWAVVPELAKAMGAYRRKVSSRANFFMKVKMELKTLAKSIAGNEEAGQEPSKKENKRC